MQEPGLSYWLQWEVMLKNTQIARPYLLSLYKLKLWNLVMNGNVKTFDKKQSKDTFVTME